MHVLAIIGGGFSGAALARRLLESGPPDLEIHIFDPRPALGWGIAYGDAGDSHILNVPADRMSLTSERPRDFLDWARRYGPRLGWPLAGAASAGSYLPRRLFGHYVSAALETTLNRTQSRGGPSLFHHRVQVESVDATQDGYRIGGAHPLAATAAVVATGFRPPSVPFPVTGSGRGLIANPWQSGALDAIGRSDSVLIVGTGLTMVDQIYSLAAARHRGSVTALSRHGMLPRVHGVSEVYAPLVTVEDCRRGVAYSLKTLRAAIAWGRCDWRSAVDGLRPITDKLWAALPTAEQRRFLRHLRPYWEVHRHRMAADSSDLLLRRIALGLLTIEAARLRRVVLSSDRPQVMVQRGHADAAEARYYDWIINCTPPAPFFAPPTDPLAEQVQAAGLARPHRSGLGLDVDERGRLLGRDGRAAQRLFALGPPRRGVVMEATAVPHIRTQLEELAPLLLSELR